MKVLEKNGLEGCDALELQRVLHRRAFLRYTGYAGTAVAVSSLLSLGACNDANGTGGVSFGSGDFAILNFAYALEQLEAAFYTQVIATPYNNISSDEMILLTDVRDHEIAHREFFKAALGSNAIQDLEVDFTSINFTSRDSVLGTAKAFEDLGVSAYNGSGRYLNSLEYLGVAGKIVAVEARHAAYIRDLVTPNSFADATIIDGNGLDVVRKPRAVLAIADPYIKTKLDASTLPA